MRIFALELDNDIKGIEQRDRYIEALGGKVGCILATGGMGRLIAPYCRNEIIVDNRLLLKGLGHIYRTNEAAKQKSTGKRR